MQSRDEINISVKHLRRLLARVLHKFTTALQRGDIKGLFLTCLMGYFFVKDITFDITMVLRLLNTNITCM
jgi:hypothetical protein